MNEKPISKMTKKEKKEYYKKFRRVWHINPVTRKTEKPSAYNRNKSRLWKNEIHDGIFFIYSSRQSTELSPKSSLVFEK